MVGAGGKQGSPHSTPSTALPGGSRSRRWRPAPWTRFSWSAPTPGVGSWKAGPPLLDFGALPWTGTQVRVRLPRRWSAGAAAGRSTACCVSAPRAPAGRPGAEQGAQQAGQGGGPGAVPPQVVEAGQAASAPAGAPRMTTSRATPKAPAYLTGGLVDGAAHREALGVEARDRRRAQHREGEPDPQPDDQGGRAARPPGSRGAVRPGWRTTSSPATKTTNPPRRTRRKPTRPARLPGRSGHHGHHQGARGHGQARPSGSSSATRWSGTGCCPSSMAKKPMA